MRMVLMVMVVAWCWAVESQGGEARSRPPARPSAALEYVNLEDWAEAHQFHFSFAHKEEEIRLTNRWAHLGFKLNSQRAEVNGITLFLTAPVVLHQGIPAIAQRDLDRSLHPILFPPKNGPKDRIKVIALSAGHGGKDCGYDVHSQQEKKYTLLLTQELQQLVSRAGLRPVLIRNTDKFVELEDRPRLAKHGKADLFVELHYNCAGPGNTESRGVEVYCLTPAGANSTNGGSDSYPPLPGNRQDEKNMLLAYQLHTALVEHVGLVDRGVRRARFVVLREAEMPAVLIEAGFMSQPEELRRIQDPAARRQTAQAILDGILAYKRLVER
jgi:N-acetylmuramoyl-L-alanine amidase